MARIKRSNLLPATIKSEENECDGTRNLKTGRPIRKSAGKRSSESAFVDSSTILVSEDEDGKQATNETSSDSGDTEDDVDLAPSIFKHAKRQRRNPSPTPPVSPPLSPLPALSPEPSPEPHAPLPPLRDLPPIALTINVEPGQSGPILLKLDLNPLYSQIPGFQSCDRPQTLSFEAALARSSNYNETKPGFLSLPKEIRDQIYRVMLVTERSLDFAKPCIGFRRSSQLLATCRQIYQEARHLLYSENKFIIARKPSFRARPFVAGSREIGYKDTLLFLRRIGQENIGLLRDVAIAFEDASAAAVKDSSYEARRFVYDAVLLSCLRNLARYGRLRTLSLSFQGRKELKIWDAHFVNAIKDIKADSVEFVDHPEISMDTLHWTSAFRFVSRQQDAVRHKLKEEMTRKYALYD